MKKYFVCSDIHGFYDEWMISLRDVGYEKDNDNHILIVLGDIFDRGDKPLEVYKFIRSIPKERRILVRGNHEILLRDLVSRKRPEFYDETNGTYKTLLGIAGINEIEWTHRYYRQLQQYKFDSDEYIAFANNMSLYRERLLYKNEMIEEILTWIASDEWANYFETDKYIFVHSFIPVKRYIDQKKSLECGYYVYANEETYRDDWRNATQTEWEDAMWGCPWKQYKAELNKTGKTIVCGHWHTSDFFNNLIYKNQPEKHLNYKTSNPIFRNKRYKIIGLDACTALTKKVNILTLGIL